jgi:hypothetical protein
MAATLRSIHESQRAEDGLSRRATRPRHDRRVVNRCDHRVLSSKAVRDRSSHEACDPVGIEASASERHTSHASGLFIPRQDQFAFAAKGDLRVARNTLRWYLLSLCEASTGLRHRIKQRHRRLASGCRARNERGPDDVDALMAIDGHRRTILGAPVEDPVVVTDADRSSESASAVSGLRECDVPNVPWVDMSPRGVHAASGVGRDRGLTAMADTASDRSRAVSLVRGCTPNRDGPATARRRRHLVLS